jgi:hypothetical protein
MKDDKVFPEFTDVPEGSRALTTIISIVFIFGILAVLLIGVSL